MIRLLDHGYIRFVEDWGYGDAKIPEAGIIEAARMSTAKGFQGWDSDEKLLHYLYTKRHSTPFEFAGMTVEVQAPIMVFREWHRHRTQAYGEMSARYVPLPNENYMPTLERLKLTSAANKQAQGVAALAPDDMLESWLDALERLYQQAQLVYETGLRYGIPKEVARLPVPVARYSRMRATTSLRNWLIFLTLRMDPAAQWEIRQFGNAVGGLIQDAFPRTWKLFEGERNGNSKTA